MKMRYIVWGRRMAGCLLRVLREYAPELQKPLPWGVHFPSLWGLPEVWISLSSSSVVEPGLTHTEWVPAHVLPLL